jgi:hypothetical protein
MRRPIIALVSLGQTMERSPTSSCQHIDRADHLVYHLLRNQGLCSTNRIGQEHREREGERRCGRIDQLARYLVLGCTHIEHCRSCLWRRRLAWFSPLRTRQGQTSARVSDREGQATTEFPVSRRHGNCLAWRQNYRNQDGQRVDGRLESSRDMGGGQGHSRPIWAERIMDRVQVT